MTITEGIDGIAHVAAGRISESGPAHKLTLGDVISSPEACRVMNKLLAETLSAEVGKSKFERPTVVDCPDDRFHELLYGRKFSEAVSVEPVTLAVEV